MYNHLRLHEGGKVGMFALEQWNLHKELGMEQCPVLIYQVGFKPKKATLPEAIFFINLQFSLKSGENNVTYILKVFRELDLILLSLESANYIYYFTFRDQGL